MHGPIDPAGPHSGNAAQAGARSTGAETRAEACAGIGTTGTAWVGGSGEGIDAGCAGDAGARSTDAETRAEACAGIGATGTAWVGGSGEGIDAGCAGDAGARSTDAETRSEACAGIGATGTAWVGRGAGWLAQQRGCQGKAEAREGSHHDLRAVNLRCSRAPGVLTALRLRLEARRCCLWCGERACRGALKGSPAVATGRQEEEGGNSEDRLAARGSAAGCLWQRSRGVPACRPRSRHGQSRWLRPEHWLRPEDTPRLEDCWQLWVSQVAAPGPADRRSRTARCSGAGQAPDS